MREGVSEAYHQISLLRARLPDHSAIIALTATLSEAEMRISVDELKKESYYVIRLSFERPNLIFT